MSRTPEQQPDGTVTAAAAALNSSRNASQALGLLEQDPTQSARFEFQVFNVTIAVLALCVLMFTALYCITVCFHRNRQLKRAHAYESAVTRGEQVEPVAFRALKSSTSFLRPFALFRRPEVERDSSRIYYIYSNPLPIGLEEEEEEREQKKRQQEKREQQEVEEEQQWKLHSAPGGLGEQTALCQSLLMQQYAEDPSSGVTLDPPMFYMQL